MTCQTGEHRQPTVNDFQRKAGEFEIEIQTLYNIYVRLNFGNNSLPVIH